MQWQKIAKQNILNKKPDLKDLLFTRKENSKNEAKKKSFSKKKILYQNLRSLN